MRPIRGTSISRTSAEYAATCRVASEALEDAMHVNPASIGAHL